jgi:hypothetical protein
LPIDLPLSKGHNQLPRLLEIKLMAEDKPGLHIDLDWKKQAQEEKKRLEEEEKKRADERGATAAAPVAPAGVVPSGGPDAASAQRPAASPRTSGKAAGVRGQRELPPAGVQSLAQSLVTQALYYLSDSAARPGEESANMDMAKHLIDTLGVLEQKTQGNLTPEEQQVLDTALYESRMRFIAVAGQVIAGT